MPVKQPSKKAFYIFL